jgi:hypothetical protein
VSYYFEKRGSKGVFLRLDEMNKCRHCGASVPVEKAFCPNCSEPIEPEEAPNRAGTSSSDMMSTMRDDPESYKELLLSLKQRSAVSKGTDVTPPGPVQTNPPPPPAATTPPPTQQPGADFRPQQPSAIPPAKGDRRTLFIITGVVAFLILVFVMLMVFKII